MNRFGKLLNFELNRFMKIYLTLIGITIVSQLVGLFKLSKEYLKTAHELIREQGMAMAEYFTIYGKFDMHNLTQSTWFITPIALAAAALIFYMLLIWYREWFGKNTFVYRLLTLPTSRINIYFAKAATIMTMLFGLISVQLILLPVESLLLKWLVPSEFRVDLSLNQIVHDAGVLEIILPTAFSDFLLYYGTGFMVLIVLFTMILIERSFRLKGAFSAIIFGALTVTIFLFPIWLQFFNDGMLLHPVELYLLEVIMGVIVITGSVLISQFLLKNKITI